MIAFIADASLTLALYMPDEWSPALDPILKQVAAGEAAAPALWVLEVGNALASAVRRKRISTQDGADLSQLFRRLPIHLIEITQVEGLTEVFQLARRHGLTTYDASYLFCALDQHLPLATNDQALAKAAAAEGVPLLL